MSKITKQNRMHNLDAAMSQARNALQSGFNDYFPKEDCVVIFPDEFTGE